MSKGNFALRKNLRAENPADMFTHVPSHDELSRFVPMIGIVPRACDKGPVEVVKAAVRSKPSSASKLAMASLAALAHGARGHDEASEDEPPSTLAKVRAAMPIIFLVLALVWMCVNCIRGLGSLGY